MKTQTEKAKKFRALHERGRRRPGPRRGVSRGTISSEGTFVETDEARAERVTPFACVMEAIEPGERRRHLDTAASLFGSVREVRELPDGYAFRLPDEPGVLTKAAEFISLERLCCPFFGFGLAAEPERGAIWLRLTGREGVKEFIRAEVGELAGGRLPW